MNGRAALAGLAAVLLVCAVVTTGCTSRDDATPTPAADRSAPDASGPALEPVTLPDLSATDAFVNEQIRAQHASLVTMIETPGATRVALGTAYADVGKLLMAAALLDAAEPYLLHAQAILPDDTRWPYYLGHLYRTMGALEKSVASFEQVLTMRPDDAVTLLSLGDVYLTQGRPEAAEPLFTRQLELQPDSVVANVGLGRAALASNDYTRAVEHLEEGLELSQQSAVGIHYPLALAYRGLGNLEQAEAHLQQRADVGILPADPLMEQLDELLESPQAYQERGNRALARGEWAASTEYFRQGLALAPDDPTLRHRLGTALFQMGDAGGATAQFEQVVRMFPDYAPAYFSLGVLLESAGRRQEAIERFDAAVRRDPIYVDARLGLASLLRRSGRLQESLSQYEQLIQTTPAITGDSRLAEAPFGYAITLVRLGRYQDARDRLTDAMAAYPGQPFFAHALARLLAAAPDDRVRDGQRAQAVMQALPEEQRRIDLGETLAMTLAEVGQYAQAAELQRDAIATATRGGRNDLVPRMAEKLTQYERGRPWRSNDPVEFDPFLEGASTPLQ